MSARKHKDKTKTTLTSLNRAFAPIKESFGGRGEKQKEDGSGSNADTFKNYELIIPSSVAKMQLCRLVSMSNSHKNWIQPDFHHYLS